MTEGGPSVQDQHPNAGAATPQPRTALEVGATFALIFLLNTMALLNAAAIYWRDSLYADLLIGDMDTGILVFAVFIFVFKLRSARVEKGKNKTSIEFDFGP